MRREHIIPLCSIVFYILAYFYTFSPVYLVDPPLTHCYICDYALITSKGRLKIIAKSSDNIGVVFYSKEISTERLSLPKNGDTLNFKNVFYKEIKNFNNEFDYKKYMARQNIHFQAYFSLSDYSVKRRSDNNDLIKDRLNYILGSSNNFSIALALSTGERKYLPEEIVENFRLSGTSHLLALSGFHLGVLYHFLLYILFICSGNDERRLLRSIFILVLLWSYAYYTGLSPSIFRAILSISVFEAAKLLSRKKHPVTALSLSAIIILLVDPNYAHSTGFQLSFSAMLGIILIYPTLLKKLDLLKTNKLINYICKAGFLSISCQIFTAPLILMNFGNYNHYFLFANILCMPLGSIIIPMIPITIICSYLPFVDKITAYILNFLVSLLDYIIFILSELNATFSFR